MLDRYVVAANGCWLWTGPRKGKYGGCNHAYAHRLMYEREVGPIPDGLLVLHRCDTPLCVNPEHLTVGTQSDNLKQMWARRRHPQTLVPRRGADHYKCKLSDADLIAIRQSDLPTASLAVIHDVHPVTINAIRCGSYRRVPQE